MIDFTDHNDDFISKHVPVDAIIFDYYLNLIPWLANFLSPLLIFVSTILVTARMAAHTEIIAILSSGVSFRRILWSFFIGAILMGAITFVMIGWVIPKATQVRLDFEMEYFNGDKHFDGRDVHIMMSPTTKVYVQSYNSKSKVGYMFTLERFDSTELVEILKTNRIAWDSTSQKWHINRYTIRTFDGNGETLTHHRNLDTTLNVVPQDFEVSDKQTQAMTLPELKEFIDVERIKGVRNVADFRVEYYERFTYPFAIVILTLIAVVSGGKKSREGVVWPVVIGFFLCFAYWIILQIGRSFASDETIHPLVSSIIPNAVFLVFGLLMYRKLPK